MFKIFNRFARRVAAIDEKLIKECPKTDRIWATHTGYMLSATFLVLITISYLSIDYFNSAKIVFDIDTNMMKLEKDEWNIWSIFTGIVIAFVIASIIFMFDRAVFQSDWFIQTLYGIDEGGWQSFKRVILKFFRIIVRLSISIAIAYALSTFLELRMYEAQIIEVMQENHLKKNQKIYNQIKQYATNVDKDIKQKTKEKNALQQRLETIMNGGTPWLMDQNILSLDEQNDHVKEEYQKSLEKLKRARETDLIPVQKRLEELNVQRRGIVKKLNRLEMKQQAEEDGIPSVDILDMNITSSGKRGDGVLSKILKKRVKQIKIGLMNIDAQIKATKREIQGVKTQYINRAKSLNKEHSQDIDSYWRTKEQYTTQAKKDYEINVKKNRSDIKVALGKATALLLKLKKSRSSRINKYNQMILKSPQFIPMRDGPLVRLMIFKKISSQGEMGKEIRQFSWIIKAFIIFLEIVPVVAKMFFSPPSVYAALLQMQVKRRVKDIFDNNDAASVQAIKDQIKLEKMRIKLNHLRNQRIVSDELNPKKVREYMKHKSSSDKKEAA